MGHTRTLIAWLVVLGLQLTPHVTYAEDGGPGREVRAIRHDLPIIVSAQTTHGKDAAPIVIDGVLVEGSDALAQWHQGKNVRIAYFTRLFHRWWLQNEVFVDPSNGSATCCGGLWWPVDLNGPTTALLRVLPHVTPTLVERAARVLPAVASADKRALEPTPTPHGGFLVGGFLVQDPAHGDGYIINRLSLKATTVAWTGVTGPYSLSSSLAANDAAPQALLANLAGRAPTAGESWDTRCGNGYFFFSATLQSDQTIHIQSGTKLDVWFPFVLDPKATYSLTIAHVTPVIGPLNGSLKDNTLHFELPAFSVEPSAELMGEIDGDPYEC